MPQTDLLPVTIALAELTDAELHALINATNEAPQLAPGLLAWIDGTCAWELNRRSGRDYRLQLPEAAIPPEQDAVSVGAAMWMRSKFEKESRTPEVLALFDVIVGLLTVAGRRQ